MWTFPPIAKTDTQANFGEFVRVDMAMAQQDLHVTLPAVGPNDTGKTILVAEISGDGVPVTSPPIFVWIDAAPGQPIDTGCGPSYAMSGQGRRAEFIAVDGGWTLGMHR